LVVALALPLSVISVPLPAAEGVMLPDMLKVGDAAMFGMLAFAPLTVNG
jgi:hypothetical protein